MVRLAIIVVILAAAVSAQVSRTAGAIVAEATDASGAVIPGASVLVTNTATGQQRRLITAIDGRALITDLAPGSYDVRVTAPGFASAEIRAIDVQLGRQRTITARLKPESTAQEVNVAATTETELDRGQTSITTSIDKERIEESPVVSRNYLDFVVLAPGLSSSNQQARSFSAPPFGDSGFSFAGQRPRSNALYIDGVENNDEFTGATRTELSLELVREFQVVNNGLAAEAGGGAGGSVNVITRSGANTIHGDAFLFLQNGTLNAREPFVEEPEKPESSKYRAGLAIGGPIVRDKLFYYVAAEQERKIDEVSSAIDPAAAAQVDQILATGVFPGLPIRRLDPGFSAARRAETEASGRLDRQSATTTASLRYSFNNNREVGDAFNAGGLNDASVRGSSFTRDHTLAASLTSVLGATRVNDARFQFSTRHAVLRSEQDSGPEVDIVGVVRFGRPYQGNLHRAEDHLEVGDSFALSIRKHLVKVGADVNRIQEDVTSTDGNGLYTFLGVADLASGTPLQFRQRFGASNANLDVTKSAGFAQHHWALSSRLSMDVGLRYDFEYLPAPFALDANNFAPRLGIAFSPVDKWVLRAGFGIFYDRYPLAFLSQALLNNGDTGFEQIFDQSHAVTTFQTLSGGVLPAPGAAPMSIHRPEPSLRSSYSEQANIGFEGLVFPKTTLTGTYLFSRGIHLSRTRNVNLQPPMELTPLNASAFGIPNPVPQQIGRPVFAQSITSGFRDIFQLENRAGSTYHGGFIAIRSKLATDFDLAANYTLSKCLDDASDYFEAPEDPYSLKAERALCAFDQRHRFVLSGLFEIGDEESGASANTFSKVFSHLEVAPIVTLGSSRPLNAVLGFDANLSHSLSPSVRPFGFGRNSLRTGRQFQTDLRVLKYFPIGKQGKLDLVAEAFNLFNHANVLARQNQFGPNIEPTADFLRPVLGSTPRQLQFSIDFEF